MGDDLEFGYSALTRRERLERIAMAERDRRAGRIDVAIASIGEPTEWPARAVVALAKLSQDEGFETRHILMEGLDLWAEEIGLASLDEAILPVAAAAASGDLDRPIENDELERAFAEAEAQTDEMHNVNDVAEHVLMNESVGLANLAGDDLVPSQDFADDSENFLSDVFGMDAAVVPDTEILVPDTVEVEAEVEAEIGVLGSSPSPAMVLETLSRWLKNIEGVRTRGMQ